MGTVSGGSAGWWRRSLQVMTLDFHVLPVRLDLAEGKEGVATMRGEHVMGTLELMGVRALFGVRCVKLC